MRNIVFSFLIGLLCLFNSNSFAQAPEKFNYQAVIRDNTGELIINQAISIRVAITNNTYGGTIFYRESHAVTTSDIGLVNLQIGTGTSDMGTFSDIDWGIDPKYLQIEIDASGSTSYIDLGTFQLLSVPYAFYAKDVENKDDADADPLNEIQDIDLSGNNLSISGGSTVDLSIIQDGVDDSDADSTNEIQDLDLTGTDLSITGGNTVDLSLIQDGVDDADADPANEIQNLLLAGDTLKISNGNEVILPYDSSNWVISGDQMYYNGGNVGIGSSAPVSNLEVKSNTGGSDALFQVINANNDTVFAVYPDGVKIFIDPDAKGRVGGFAISGRSPSKAGEEVEYMRVTTDSTRIYVNEPIDGKGSVGGFAISGRSPSKGIVNDYLVVTGDSTRIYVNDSLTVKGRVGGFAISGRSPSKGTINDYLHVTRDSTRVYITESATKGSVGGFAISGRSPSKGTEKDYFNVSGNITAQTIDPSEARIFWYPKKEAFLTGRVLVESPDSVGTNSMATGFESKAIGDYSQAMGYKAIARGDYSTAIGDSAVAIGLSSFSFGEQTRAEGKNTFAFGKESVAKGERSYAFGSSLANIKTQALKDDAFALGLGCISNGIGAIAIGTSNESNANYSFSGGRSNIANKVGATALGQLVTSSGSYSTALGYNTTASGDYSTALGYYTTASGLSSTAMGRSTNAIGSYSFASGYNCTASGINSVVIGMNSTASGAISIALGESASANYQNSIAIGQSSNVTDWHGVALGYNTEADKGALATGYGSKAYGEYSLAAGFQAKANANYSFSIGDNTQSSGQYSTAMGFWSVSEGERSFAMGDNATSKSYVSFVVGRFNDLTSSSATTWVGTDPLFIVGNGTSPAARSNALTVFKNGNVEFSGNLIGAFGTIAQSTDEWLRLNPSNTHSAGTYLSGILRADGGIYVGDDESFSRSAEDVIYSGDNLRIDGEIRQSSSDYGAYEIQTPGQIYTNDYLVAMGGVHVGGTSDPGTDNLYIDGCVGIGVAPISDKLYVYNGTTYGAYTTSGWQHSSDRRFKTNIKSISSSLQNIMKLQGVYFNWRSDQEKRQIGFIAQDVEAIIPEVVSKNDDGYYSISYGNFAPILVEAVKEQQSQIEELKSENLELKQKLEEIIELLGKQ